MEELLALVGVALPWLCGSLLVACVWRWRGPAPSIQYTVGYGMPFGIVIVILWMRLLSALNVQFTVWSVALPMAVLAFALVFVLQRLGSKTTKPSVLECWRDMPLSGRVVWWGLCFLIAMRGMHVLFEILWRPTFGWDAWAHWATKAKVWYSLGFMAPFGSVNEVLGGTAQYTDANPHYPPAIPLILVWQALWVGRWDDTLVNLPWLGFGVAMGFGFFAQLRSAAAGPLFSLGATFALLSLPFLGVHIALPGYADFPLAVLVGLASISFWRWSIERRWEHLVIALILALSGPMFKTPGWVWLALLAPAALPARFGKRGWQLILLLGGAAALVLLALSHFEMRLLGYQLKADFQPVWKPLLETMLTLSNWHLLWYAVIAAVFLGGRRLFSDRMAALTTYVGGGFGFLFAVFFFSNAAMWVSDLSTVNRALLHLTPTIVFTLSLLALDLRTRLRGPSHSPTAAPSTPLE